MDSKWEKLLKQYDQHCVRIAKATTVDIGETPGEKAKRVKNLEKDYISWFEYYLPHYAKCECAPFHRKLANNIISNRKSKTIERIYRSGAKSVHGNIGVPLYLMVTDELYFMVLMGETEIKSKQLLSDIQAELESNQRFINDYGRKLGKGTWAEGNFLTSDGRRFYALGFGQSPRGLREGSQRPDYFALDDTATRKHLNNRSLMRDHLDFVLEEVFGCFDASDDSIERFVFLNNDFDERCLTHLLVKEFEKYKAIDKLEGRKSDYIVHTVCAVIDLVDFVPTWSAKTSSEYWRKKYLKNPKAFLREYMHVHVAEGKIFKMDWMFWDKMLRLMMYDALIFIGDLSYKDKGDFKGMFLIGKKGKFYHIIHSFLRQTSRKMVAEWLYDKFEDRNLARYNVRYLIDGLFAQDEFVNDFDEEGEQRGYYIPVVANKKSYGNKFDHIDSISGKFERGWVVWNIDEKNLPDQMTAIQQFLNFEKGGGDNDDGPDGIGVGFKELDEVTFVEKSEPRIIKRETYQDQNY